MSVTEGNAKFMSTCMILSHDTPLVAIMKSELRISELLAPELQQLCRLC